MTIDLKIILQKYPNCLDGRLALRAALKDHYPEEERMIHLLTILYDCGIAEKIKGMETVSESTAQNFVSLAESRYGISPQYTRTAIEIWAAAYGIAVETISPPKQKPALPPDPAPSRETVFSAKDYDLVKREDGWYVAKFKEEDVDSVTVPKVLYGHPIVGIAKNAFAFRSDLRTVELEKGIKILEEYAFNGCSSLSSISLPKSLKSIGAWAFSFTDLRCVSLPDSISYIGKGAFCSCDQLSAVNLPSEIKNIEADTFAGCSNLINISLPASLRRIRTTAFDACNALKTLELPEGTKVIEEGAFSRTRLKSITIPNTVTSIGSECSKPGWMNDKILLGDDTLGAVKMIKCQYDSCAYRYATANGLRTRGL